ncbi:hypothetical protein ACFVJS_03755 [Nocardioides sp. NPDC057772]|uniref:hypothetical protein n=1 Tax=Nocardioides sp. NPDC057772 TaxID=3346245 RepID=UPI00366F5157
MRLFPATPPNISDRTVRWAWIFVGILAGAVVVGMLVWLWRLSSDSEADDRAIANLEADRAKLSKRLDEQQQTSAEQMRASIALAEQVKRLGGKPVVEPGEPAAPIPPLGPTQAQVNTAVSVICAGSRSACRPTDAQVKTTLRAICGDCRGEDAKPPKDGEDGEDATPEQIDAAVARQIDAAIARHCGEDGCRGPGPTDQQIDDRLAAYCGAGNCRGQDGRSVESVACEQGTGRFTFTYSDGSTQTIECFPAGGVG